MSPRRSVLVLAFAASLAGSQPEAESPTAYRVRTWSGRTIDARAIQFSTAALTIETGNAQQTLGWHEVHAIEGPRAADAAEQIQPLRGMMGDVRGPHPAHAVAHPVEPVVEKVLTDEQGRNHPGTHVQVQQPELINDRIKTEQYDPGQSIGDLMHAGQGHVRQGVAPGVLGHSTASPVQGLPQHAAVEDGGQGQQNQ